MKAIGNPRLFLSSCLCASKILCIRTVKKTIDILEEHFWKSCLLQIYSHLKETESTFFNFFLNFFFSFLLSGKSGCFLISEVKLGLRDRSSPSRDADIGKEQEELGKLPLDLIRLRRVFATMLQTPIIGERCQEAPFLILNSWEIANELQLKLRLPADEKENLELLLTEINDFTWRITRLRSSFYQHPPPFFFFILY